MSDDKISQNLLDLLEDSKSCDTRINLNQSQFTQMGEFKFIPLKTSEERSIMRNGISSTSGIFGRTALGRTGSGSTILPPTSVMLSTTSPPSQGHPPSGRIDNRRSNKGAYQMQGPNIEELERTTPLELSKNRWVPQVLDNPSPKLTEDFIPFDAVQREVKVLLNKLTLKNFFSISSQIIDYANKSKDERDGRMLREVTRLIFESSFDDTRFCAIYAQLCRIVMERVDPEIIDENVKNIEGKCAEGATLFRKYLLNRCQENFQKDWKVNIPFPSNDKGEFDLYYAAAKAKRQRLSLVIFLCELFKLNMLTERIMHEIIKKLLIFQGSPDEAEMERLCKLMEIIGKQLDHVEQNQHKLTQFNHEKAKKYMSSYFDRMEEISRLPNLSNRIKFMIMDVIDLRNNAWKSRREIHDDIAKREEGSKFPRRTASSGASRGMPKMAEQMSRRRINPYGSSGNDGWSTVGGSHSQRNKEKVGDLTFGSVINRSKIVSLAPGGILESLSGGAKGWTKSDNNSTTSIYSVLNSESSKGRKSSESISSDAQKPFPPTARKKLILAPRTKSFTPEESVKLAFKSTFRTASSAQTKEELVTKKICNNINNMVEEYFSIWDSREVITCLKEDIPVEYHPKAIETFVNKAIEKKQRDVDNVMKLFKEIVSSRTCDTDIFKDGFTATFKFLEDIGADAPMAYSFTGQLLSSTGLDLRDITKLLKPFDDDNTVVKILNGYANALKNDVDEQGFDLKLVFQKKK